MQELASIFPNARVNTTRIFANTGGKSVFVTSSLSAVNYGTVCLHCLPKHLLNHDRYLPIGEPVQQSNRVTVSTQTKLHSPMPDTKEISCVGF